MVLVPPLGGLVPGTLVPLPPRPFPQTACSFALLWEQPSGNTEPQRAWTAGLEAGKVLRGEVDCVPPTPELLVKSRVYIVLCTPSSWQPRFFRNFSEFKAYTGKLRHGTVCHGFPTEGEARVYCRAASVSIPRARLRNNERQRASVCFLGPFGALHRESPCGRRPSRQRCSSPVCTSFAAWGWLPAVPPHRVCAAKLVGIRPGGPSFRFAWPLDRLGGASFGGRRGRGRRTYLGHPLGFGRRCGRHGCCTYGALRPGRWDLRCSFRPGAASQVFPRWGRLLALTRAWLRTQQDDRLGFYSAVEEGEAGLPEEEAPEAAPADPVGAKKAAAKAKRVTTNQLASQIDQLLSAMPRLTDQLQQLGARQQALEERVSAAPAGSTQRPKPAHQMPFFPPKNLTGAGGSASAFASYFGPPPKTGPAKAAAADQAPAHAAVSPEALDPEGADDAQSSSLQGALAQQGSALTLLVNHLIAQASENSGDFGGGAAGSSSLSSKGTARRDRLQAELAEHTGNFMLAVVQMGFRRMYPAGQQPRSLEEVRANPPPFRFQDYIERYGGYGQQRDLGLVAFMVSQIADLLISGEVEGALDSLSLLLVALEQAAQDSGKWEVAYALSMFPDPPSQVFQSRPSPHNARLRAWAPLCPAPWCTTTLAYLKEADAILARRTEALSSASRKTDASDKEEPKRPPRKPRFPRKPKQEGQ